MSVTITKLGKYRVLGELGRGAMGVVYRGFDPDIEREVAIKTLRSDLLSSAERDTLLERFRKEAQAAGRLNHPGIVQVYEYGVDEDQVFIAMELIKGSDLSDYFDEDARFNLKDIVRMLGELLDALGYAHEHGVVHRDIKPSNIVVLDDGHIKVTDFGIARLESSTLTQAGTLLGTPGYMSPEQFMAQRVDGRSDLFSAGVVLYVLLTSEAPFSGNSFATVMHKVLKEEPIPPSELNITVPPRFDAVVARALAKRPDQRYDNAAAFKQDLEAALGGQAVAAPTAMLDATRVTTGTVTALPDAATVVLGSQVAAAQAGRLGASLVMPAMPTAPATPQVMDTMATVVLKPRGPGKPSRMLLAGVAAGLLVLAGGGLWILPGSGKPATSLSAKADAPTAKPGAAAGSGEVQVTSEPPGAVIIIDDGRYGGVSPASINLPVGEHRLQVRKEGYQDLEANVAVAEGSRIPFEARLTPVQ